MSTLAQISVLPHQQEEKDLILKLALKKSKIQENKVREWRLRKRSIDARRAPVKINLQIATILY